ncbi:hypothetical protein H0X32_01775 [Patescibacteria group bacterium]|nr:hypothetical protein [Patescibacteria group bacterium]
MEHISTYTDEKTKILNKGPRFVRWAVMLGIVIALNIFFFVVNSLIFPAPKYEDFCRSGNAPAPLSQDSCITEGGTWSPAPPVDPVGAQNVTVPKTPDGYCDLYTKCQKPFQTAQQDHQLKTFGVLVGFGVLSLIIGVFPIGSSIVSGGLSYGGVLAMVIGSAQYWSEAGNWLRLGISFIALVVLLYIGYKRFRD